MGAEPVRAESEGSQVEGLKNLMIGDLKQAAAPETPPRAENGMDVCQKSATSPERVDGPQTREDSDGKWQALPRQYELSDFQPIKKLYRGYASKVYLAEDVGKLKHQQQSHSIKDAKEQHRVVLKVYDLLKLSPLTKYQLEREIKIHSSIKHKNIVRLEAAFTQTDFAILVQDYAPNGDLYTFLHKQRMRFSERKIVNSILLPCMDALAYLHSNNIAHRDIKPENLLLDENNNIMLADFGLSVCVAHENAVTRAGTMDYMAPEVLVCPLKRLPTDYKERKDLAYTVKVDSWSIGVLAFELITGRTPFRHRDEEDMLQTIKTTKIRFPSGMSTLARDWIQQAMTLNPHERANIHELASHPWISSHRSNPSRARMSSAAISSTPSLPSTSSCANTMLQQQSISSQNLEALGCSPARLEHGHASPAYKDQIGSQPSSFLEIPHPRADDTRSEESRIPKAPSASRANSLMQQISAHLKPQALFGSFREKSTARENQ